MGPIIETPATRMYGFVTKLQCVFVNFKAPRVVKQNVTLGALVFEKRYSPREKEEEVFLEKEDLESFLAVYKNWNTSQPESEPSTINPPIYRVLCTQNPNIKMRTEKDIFCDACNCNDAGIGGFCSSHDSEIERTVYAYHPANIDYINLQAYKRRLTIYFTNDSAYEIERLVVDGICFNDEAEVRDLIGRLCGEGSSEVMLE